MSNPLRKRQFSVVADETLKLAQTNGEAAQMAEIAELRSERIRVDNHMKFCQSQNESTKAEASRRTQEAKQEG